MYHVSTKVNSPVHGSLSVSPEDAYEGDPVTVTVTPDEGYVLSYIEGGSITKVNDTTYTTVMPGYDLTIYATFKLAPGFYFDNTDRVVPDYYVPEEKFSPSSSSFGEWEREAVLTEGKFIDVMAVYTPELASERLGYYWCFQTTKLTYSSSNNRPKVTAEQAGHAMVFLTETEREGYTKAIHLSRTYMDPSFVWDAWWIIKNFHLINVADADNGSVAADLAEAYEGQTVTLTATPASGYRLGAFTVLDADENEIPVEGNSFAMPDGPVTVTASFIPDEAETYTIIVDANIQNGSVSTEPTQAREGDTVTVTVSPDKGYQLSSLTRITGNEDHFTEIPFDEETQTYHFKMPAGNVIVYASFEAAPHEHVDADGDLFCDICHKRMGVVVTVSSAANSLSGPSVAFVQGGAKLYFGESTTLKAPLVTGYSFEGWYCGGELVTAEMQYSYTVPEDAEEDVKFIALYSGAGSFNLIVTGSRFRLSGLNAVQRSFFNDKMPANSQITLSFEGSETFLYWINASGKIVSTNPEYSFYLVSNSEFYAVYAESEDNEDEALVVFLNSRTNGQVLASHYYSASDSIVYPNPPVKMGRVFEGWSLTEEEIHAAMAEQNKIMVYARFATPSETYKITVKNNIDDSEREVGPVTVGSEKTVRADESLGSFSYWKLNDKIVSYDPTIVVRSMSDVVLLAVYNEEVTPIPVVTITETIQGMEEGKYAFTFVAMRAVPESYTLVKQGLVFTTREDLDGKDLKEIMVLDGDGIRDYNTSSTELDGVTVLTLRTDHAVTVHVRGYVVVMKDGVTETYYSDEIEEQTYIP